MRRLEKKLKTKWLPVLHSSGRIPQDKVEEFKRDVEMLKNSGL